MKSGSINLDWIFMQILNDLKLESVSHAEKSLESILKVSKEFVSKGIHSDLMDFYRLYFHSSAEMEQKTESINKNVDDLIDQVKSLSEQGIEQEDIAATISETKEKTEERVNLSVLQKKIESLISLEEGVKAQLAPVLASMKCEDITRRRLETIIFGMESIIRNLGDQFSSKSVGIGESISEMITNSEERQSYISHVLGGDKLPTDSDDELDDFWDKLGG